MTVTTDTTVTGHDFVTALRRRFGRLKASGASGSAWVAVCPGHDDRVRSLSLFVGRSGRLVAYCHAGCNEAAVLAAAGLTASELQSFAAGLRAVPARRVGADERAALARYVEESCARLRSADTRGYGGQALAYAEHRFRLDREALLELRVGYDPGLDTIARPDFLHVYDAVLTIPYLVGGRVAGLQGRIIAGTGESRWLAPAGSGWARAGTFALWRPGLVAVTEGPSDALAACGAGLAAVAIRGAGLAKTEGGALRALLPVLREIRGRDVVAAGDGDTAGELFSANVAAALRGTAVRSVRIAHLRERQDVAAVLRDSGPGGVRELIEEARP
jgi:putative DNA primase/helicase